MMNLLAITPPSSTPPVAKQTGPSSWAVEVQPAHEEQVGGPFNFSFSVPFIPARVAQPDQTVTASGVAMALERLSVTPSETRVFLRYDPPNGQTELDWYPIVEIEGAMQSVQGSRKLSDNTWSYSFFAPLYDRQGEWTVTVKELVGMEPVPKMQPGEQPKQVRLAGPWVFHFTVPPAAK